MTTRELPLVISKLHDILQDLSGARSNLWRVEKLFKLIEAATEEGYFKLAKMFLLQDNSIAKHYFSDIFLKRENIFELVL